MYNTLLRYPGGKTKAVRILEQYLPSNVKTLSSIFFGGGSFELYLESKGVKITAHDSFKCLINFWIVVALAPQKLNEIVSQDLKKGVTRKTFKQYQNDLRTYEESGVQYSIDIASKFFVVNRCSFSGLTLSGGISKNHPRFNYRAVNAITNYDYSNIEFNQTNFQSSIPMSVGSDLVFMDPPYHIGNSNLYGINGSLHNNFDHELLCKYIKRFLSGTKFMLCYNDIPLIRDLYKDYNIVELEWPYAINNKPNSSEILITNY